MSKPAPDKLWNRIKSLLPRSHDPTLVLLKGHLLIEEQLFAYIAAHCRNESKLEDARLTFAQKLRIAQALSGGSSDLLDALEKLNGIRNRLAHRAEVRDLDSWIDDYLRACDREQFIKPRSPRERTRYLRNTVVVQIGILAGMSEWADHIKNRPSHARRA